MSNITTRIKKLEGKFMTKDSYEALLDKHVVKNKRYLIGLDKQLLIDTVIALHAKDYPEHRLYSRAKEYLAWVSTMGYGLIKRAYKLIDDFVDAGFASFKPNPIDVSTLDTDKVRPPYAWFCRSEQLAECPNKPFWQ